MQKIPEAPDGKLELCMPKNESKSKRKKPTFSFEQDPSDWKDMFSPDCQQDRTPLCQVSGSFAYGLCPLLASQHAKSSNIKTPLDMTTLNFVLSATRND